MSAIDYRPGDQWSHEAEVVSGAEAKALSLAADGSLAAHDELLAADQELLEQPLRCGCCDAQVDLFNVAIIKRGALTIERDTFSVMWRGKQVALSPTETHMLASIATRGYASFRGISELPGIPRLSAQTRDVLLHRIRRKFVAVGAAVPFTRCGNAGVRLVVEPDETGSTATVIGLRRSATVFVRPDSNARQSQMEHG